MNQKIISLQTVPVIKELPYKNEDPSSHYFRVKHLTETGVYKKNLVAGDQEYLGSLGCPVGNPFKGRIVSQYGRISLIFDQVNAYPALALPLIRFDTIEFGKPTLRSQAGYYIYKGNLIYKEPEQITYLGDFRSNIGSLNEDSLFIDRSRGTIGAVIRR